MLQVLNNFIKNMFREFLHNSSRLRRRQRSNVLRVRRNRSALRIERNLTDCANRFIAVGKDLHWTQWAQEGEDEAVALFSQPIIARNHMFRHIGQAMIRVGRSLRTLRADVLDNRGFNRYRGILGPLREVYNEMRVFRWAFRKYHQLIRSQLRRSLVPHFNVLDVSLNGLFRLVENESHTRVRVNVPAYNNILQDMQGDFLESMGEMLLENDDVIIDEDFN